MYSQNIQQYLRKITSTHSTSLYKFSNSTTKLLVVRALVDVYKMALPYVSQAFVMYHRVLVHLLNMVCHRAPKPELQLFEAMASDYYLVDRVNLFHVEPFSFYICNNKLNVDVSANFLSLGERIFLSNFYM